MSIKDAIAGAGVGARTGKLSEIGDILRGKIIKAELRQAKDDDGKPDTWDDGNPKQQIVVIIQTDLDEGPDDEGREDDGKRAVYVKWWGDQRKALLAAIRKAEVDDLYPGADFAVKLVDFGEKVKKTWSPPKILAFKVGKPPVVAGDVDDEFGDEESPKVEAKPTPARRTSAAKTNVQKSLDDAGLDSEDF